LATNDHFSSNWTARVWGGKSHEVVVEPLGVFAGPKAITHHGVLADAHQAAGLTDADPFGHVLQDGHDLVLGQPGVEQRCALALGEAVLAGAAIQQPALLPALAHADGQVAVPALAIVRAFLVLTAEAFQVVHDAPSLGRSRRELSGATGNVTKGATGVQY
jgi:hypothetical protein